MLPALLAAAGFWVCNVAQNVDCERQKTCPHTLSNTFAAVRLGNVSLVFSALRKAAHPPWNYTVGLAFLS